MIQNGEVSVKTANILGVSFHNVTLMEAVDAAMEQIRAGKKGYVVTPNPEIVYETLQDPVFRDIVNRASFVLPDGIGVIYAARILGVPLAGKVPGIDFADALMYRMSQEGMRLFLLGAKPGVAEQAAVNLQKKYPGLIIAGTQDGYFQDEQQAVDAVKAAGGADVMFTCLGAPKQERFMAGHLDELPVTLSCGLGGSLDVFAGTVQRAPEIFIRLNLEWFYRLCKQPSRIGRMMKLPLFLLIVIKTRLFGGRKG
ncbi:MAG: WecB/TagA/CpsF family glycosyltransferase [Butyricicoccus pullicaecorum]|nr:WecB/TagA/CpsF family glycosyltransferase [Butyricicoccus pullicaecorum]